MAKDFGEVTEKVRETLLEEFDSLKVKRDKGDLTDVDLDYYLARDRKAALILKTLQMDLSYEVLRLRRGDTNKKIAAA